MITHDLWFHESLGWFAVRLEERTVTGVAGPLSWHTALDGNFDPACCEPRADQGFRIDPLPRFDESEWATRRARETPEQYMNLAKWLRGGTDYHPRSPLIEVALGLLDEGCFLLSRWFRPG